MAGEFQVGDSVAINGLGEAVPAKANGTYEIIGVVGGTDIKIVSEREPDVIDRLAALTNDKVKKRVDQFDKDRRDMVLRAHVRVTTPYQGDVIVSVGRDDP